MGVFHQDIENYVFATFLEEENDTGVPHRLMLYTAEDVTFSGIDGQVSHRLDDGSVITLFGDYVRADLKSANDELPRISPGRLGARYDWSSGPWTADVECYRTFKQDRAASYETSTPDYNMLNATVSYRVDLGQRRFVDLYVRGTNLTNDLAFSHTSFVKDQSPLRGRNLVFGVRHTF